MASEDVLFNLWFDGGLDFLVSGWWRSTSRSVEAKDIWRGNCPKTIPIVARIVREVYDSFDYRFESFHQTLPASRVHQKFYCRIGSPPYWFLNAGLPVRRLVTEPAGSFKAENQKKSFAGCDTTENNLCVVYSLTALLLDLSHPCLLYQSINQSINQSIVRGHYRVTHDNFSFQETPE